MVHTYTHTPTHTPTGKGYIKDLYTKAHGTHTHTHTHTQEKDTCIPKLMVHTHTHRKRIHKGLVYQSSWYTHTHTHTHAHTGKGYIKDLYTKAHGKALVQMVELQPGLNHFFHGTPFSLNDWDKQLFLRVGYLAGDLSKMNNVSYHIKENNWQNLLNMINSSFQLKIKVLQNMPATVTW